MLCVREDTLRNLSTTIYYYLLLLTTTYYYLLLLTTTYYYSLLLTATTYYLLLLLATTNYYLRPLLTTTYYYLLLLTTTSYSLLLLGAPREVAALMTTGLTEKTRCEIPAKPFSTFCDFPLERIRIVVFTSDFFLLKFLLLILMLYGSHFYFIFPPKPANRHPQAVNCRRL